MSYKTFKEGHIAHMSHIVTAKLVRRDMPEGIIWHILIRAYHRRVITSICKLRVNDVIFINNTMLKKWHEILSRYSKLPHQQRYLDYWITSMVNNPTEVLSLDYENNKGYLLTLKNNQGDFHLRQMPSNLPVKRLDWRIGWFQ